MALSAAPYIFFNGKSSEAMEYYKSIFGGTLEVQTSGNLPEEVRQQSDNPTDWVIHAKLEAEGMTIYATDSKEASEKAAKIELCVMGEDENKMRTIFEKLSEGGSVRSPLKKEFWGDYFGVLTDKYGIDWMIDITVPKE